jgi:hypothetical protein
MTQFLLPLVSKQANVYSINLNFWENWGNFVSIVTKLQAELPTILASIPGRLLSPPSLLSSGFRQFFSGKSART